MSSVAHSTIAQAVYANAQACNFARVVAELDAFLSDLRNHAIEAKWDNENVVTFDVDDTRIVLGWSEDRYDDLPICLLVSVGPARNTTSAVTDPLHERLCSRLVEHIYESYPAEAVLWRQLPLTIEADLVDALMDCLPPLHETWCRDGTRAAGGHFAANMLPPKGRIPLASLKGPANDRPDLPALETRRLAKVRSALYEDDQTVIESPQIRLAAQAMNATLIMVWMPLGVAAMTYTLLKGEKIGFSARIMAVTGTFVGMAQTPLGQHLAAMAGV